MVDIYELGQLFLGKAAELGFKLQGPVETEYGWGWSQTISFWYEQRRVHFYHNLRGVKDEKYGHNFVYDDQVTVEAADLESNPKVARGTLNTVEEAWAVVEAFLVHHQTFEKLPDCTWKFDSSDYDKFIPHPPNKSNPGNIADLVSRMDEPWHPQDKDK